MTTATIPPGNVPITLACNVCGAPIQTHHDWTPKMLADRALQAQMQSFIRMVACDACKGHSDEKAKRLMAAERLENKTKTWETLCPFEFRKELDWSKCNRANYDRIMGWQFGPRGLLVSGRTGLSKTRFLCCVLRREHLAGRRCVFVAHIDFRREVSFLAQTDAAAMRRYMRVLTSADVVLFDDLGAGVITPAGEEAFEMIFSAACRNGKPFLFSANAPETLPQRFSAERSGPIMRRLAEFTEPIQL